MNIGTRIKELRIERKLTQKELADILTVSDRTVSKWEQLKGNPDVEMLPKLAETLGVSCDYILNGKESSFRTNNAQSLCDFISVRIEPHHLRQNDIPIIESLYQQHEFNFLCSCFLIALGQVASKSVEDDAFVETLMTQFRKILFVKSRPILVQKMSELYFKYKSQEFESYLSKESFTKRMYYYLNKAGLTTDEEKVAYIDNTLLPIIVNSRSNEEFSDNLKKLLKRESPFDADNLLEEDPVDDRVNLKRLMLLDLLETEDYLAIIQYRKRITAKEKRQIKRLLSNYRLKDSVANLMIDYVLFKSNYVLKITALEKMLDWAESKSFKNVKEAIKTIIVLEKQYAKSKKS